MATVPIFQSCSILIVIYIIYDSMQYYRYFFLPIVFATVISYLATLMLCSIDFWVVKNIIGRKLVKLRWWYIVDDASGGVEKWIFESKCNVNI